MLRKLGFWLKFFKWCSIIAWFLLKHWPLKKISEMYHIYIYLFVLCKTVDFVSMLLSWDFSNTLKIVIFNIFSYLFFNWYFHLHKIPVWSDHHRTFVDMHLIYYFNCHNCIFFVIYLMEVWVTSFSCITFCENPFKLSTSKLNQLVSHVLHFV